MKADAPDNPVRIGAARARNFIADVLEALGVSEADAECVAIQMIEADLTGADAHGIFRLPQYAVALLSGKISPTAQPVLSRTGPSTALVDGHNGPGHRIMTFAAEQAIQIARETGVAWVGVRGSNHAGAGGVYASMPCAHGMIGIYSAVSGVNHMAPAGSAEPLIGTNPLAIAVPGPGDAPFVLDIGMSTVASGVIAAFALQGRTMPDGWVIDRATGEAITDPKRVSGGLLTSMGGHKGLGLAFMLGLLGGPLNGAAFGKDIPDFAAGGGFGNNSGHFIVALDVERFLPLSSFLATVERQVDEMTTSGRADATAGIRLPGTERARRRAERVREGLLISRELLDKLDLLAHQLRISRLEMRSD
ncbi:Ldh family oxidoreductase [Paraburkholderia megapolitana]|uniref:Ldh family oxidoreductase n=1 Tax=Paraburkholderia megapolitana TaxID=420953 RepID=UPI0038BADDA6